MRTKDMITKYKLLFGMILNKFSHLVLYENVWIPVRRFVLGHWGLKQEDLEQGLSLLRLWSVISGIGYVYGTKPVLNILVF